MSEVNKLDIVKDTTDTNQAEETLELSKTTSRPSKSRASVTNQRVSIDGRQLRVPVSKELGKAKTKKHFCPYCKTLQTKFARHLEYKHKNEAAVRKFIHFPKGNPERLKMIECIRKQGDFLHNTDAELNTGILIPCRRPQAKFQSTTDNYICCNNCKGYFSKRTLRLHYSKCNPKHEKGKRGQAIKGRRLVTYMHRKANEIMRCQIFPVFHDDNVSRTIKYDELLIIFGNRLCEKYTLDHQHDMIRSQLRILGRFKLTIQELNREVTDFASVFHPRFYDDAIRAIRKCAKYDPKTKMFESPSNATTLGTLLKKCAKLQAAECIKTGNKERKEVVDDFLLLLEQDFCIAINRKVTEDRTKQRRTKQIVLPSKNDIKKLYTYLDRMAEDALNILKKSFDYDAWKNLSEASLILVQMFNRRRAGEIERLSIQDYDNQQTIDKSLNEDICNKVSKESQEQAKQFVRLTIRGKLGRTVPVLLDTCLNIYIKTIIKYRKQARVASSNEYVFAVPNVHSLQKEYFRACPLMRKFANDCGADIPSALRGTMLRKHIATYTAMLRMEEGRVADLANFLGHDTQIHKDVYRIPNGVRDMTEVSQILQAAMGDDDEDEDDDEDDDDHDNGNDNNENKNNEDEVSEHGENNEENERASTSGSQNNTLSTVCGNTRVLEDTTSDSDSTIVEETFSARRKRMSPYGKTCRRKWTDDEKMVVSREFGDLLRLQKLPSLQQCQALIRKQTVLTNRTPQQLKSWIDNQRRAEDRKTQRQINVRRK